MRRRDALVTAALAVALVAIAPAFSRVFVDDTWRPRYLAAGLLALALAALVRRTGGGGLVAAGVSVAGLAMFTYVTALPEVGLLPDGSSLEAFRALLDDAAAGLREEIAPARVLPSFVVAIATGGWLAAHLAHELSVRFQRPGAGLVPLVVLWALPLTVPMDDVAAAGARALPFLAAAGLVLLLGTDRGHDGSDRATLPGLAVGAAALALVAVLPSALPGFDAAAWVDLRGSDAPRGYQPIVDVTERLQLPEERDVLRVRAPERTYLRLAGLDSFDGGTWRLGSGEAGRYQPPESSLYRADRPFPPEQPARATTPTRVEVEVLDLANIYVPAPYQATVLDGDLSDEVVWSTDGGFLATWNVAEGEHVGGEPRVGVSEGTSYTVAADRPTPTIEQLREAEADAATRERWTALPREYERLAELTRNVYGAAEAATDVDRALALQDWFTDGRFTYDLDVPALRGDDALERFVVDDRRGYCEYFATAMAVMLRATDVPARVVVGFLPGAVTDTPGEDGLTEYTVTTSDAHAWVEVLFPGYGWVTFEPTPRSDLTQIVPTTEDLAPVENLRERRLRELADLDSGEEDVPVPDTPGTAEPTEPEAPLAEEPATPGSAGEEGTERRAWPWVVVALALVGVAAAAVTGSTRRAAIVHGRPHERVLAAQRSLLAAARRYGVGRAPHETTREVVDRWRREGRVTADADRFAALAQAAAFGGEVDDLVAAEAERLVAELEAELRGSVPTRDRLLAPVRVPFETSVAGVRRVATTVSGREDRPR